MSLYLFLVLFFFFKQKTAYEMRISDWVSDVCSSYLPSVGLLFLVPCINETLRVNGSATVITDAARLAPLEMQGRVPASALEISVREVFFHCGKALIRSELWNPERHVPRSAFPTLGRVLADQIAGVEAEAADRNLDDAYRTRLY